MYSKYFQYFDVTFILQGLKAIYIIKIGAQLETHNIKYSCTLLKDRLTV